MPPTELCASNSQAVAITCIVSILVTAIVTLLLYKLIQFVRKHRPHFKQRPETVSSGELMRSGMSSRSTDTISNVYVNYRNQEHNASVFTPSERSATGGREEHNGGRPADSSIGFSLMEVFEGPQRDFELERNQAF